MSLGGPAGTRKARSVNNEHTEQQAEKKAQAYLRCLAAVSTLLIRTKAFLRLQDHRLTSALIVAGNLEFIPKCQQSIDVEPSCEVVDEETQETRTVRWPAFSSSEPPAVAVFDSQNILSIPATPPREAVCKSLWNGLPYTKEKVPNEGLPCVGTKLTVPCQSSTDASQASRNNLLHPFPPFTPISRSSILDTQQTAT
jgi:hypothetical protein